MKTGSKTKVTSLVLALAIILASTSVTACAGEKEGLTWNDIPIYPGAELGLDRSWTVLPEEEPWSQVAWRFYLAGDKYSVSEVTSFYKSRMPAEGWQEVSGLGHADIEQILWSYCDKISLYVPTDVAKRVSSWAYYDKNNETDWAAVWIGINKDWEEADKTFIVIMRAS